MSSFNTRFSGWLLFITAIIVIFVGFYKPEENIDFILVATSSSACLIAVLLLFPRLSLTHKCLVSIITLIGFSLAVMSEQLTLSLIMKAGSVNLPLIGLIVCVSFLKLLINVDNRNESLPTGNKAIWKTLCGLHLFGAVINLSAIAIFGDRFTQTKKLSRSQLKLLSRTFGADALWSPFFAAMGAALLYSNGANVFTLMGLGLLLAICSIVITGSDIIFSQQRTTEIFEGYPMHLDSLVLPLILSVLVVMMHFFFPDISILILVSLVVLLTVFIVMFKKHKPSYSISTIKKHITNNIANSSGEVSLFLSAGIMATGISIFLSSTDYQIPLTEFNGIYAAIILGMMMIVALVGVHPIISISVLGGVLAPLEANPNLIGLMFLFSWGLSVVLSPLSGISMVIQSRYQIAALQIIKTNAAYSIIMYSIAAMLLIFSDKYFL